MKYLVKAHVYLKQEAWLLVDAGCAVEAKEVAAEKRDGFMWGPVVEVLGSTVLKATQSDRLEGV